MRTIKWYLETGMQGGDREGEFEVEDDALEEEIDLIAREEALNFISWSWEDVTPAVPSTQSQGDAK